MAPPAGRRIGDDFAGDSDSDVSITGLDDETTRAKGKGKGKAIDRSKKDKGKGKAKEVTIYYISLARCNDRHVCVATIRLGGIIHSLVGHCSGGRGGQARGCSPRPDCSGPEKEVCSFAIHGAMRAA